MLGINQKTSEGVAQKPYENGLQKTDFFLYFCRLLSRAKIVRCIMSYIDMHH